MWLLVFASLALGLAYLAFRRWSVSPVTGTEARESRGRELLRIVTRRQSSCAAAQALQSHRFKPGDEPKLPLAECTQSAACACRYEMVEERRVRVRRRGGDRRAQIRWDPDNPPRRSGPGRRKEDWIGWVGTLTPFWSRPRLAPEEDSVPQVSPGGIRPDADDARGRDVDDAD